MKYKVDDLPDAALPSLEELTGDMRYLANLVGVRMALKISELFDCTPIRLYGHRRWILNYRDSKIRAEYDSGNISGVELARKYGLSDRQIWNIIGKEPGDDRQLRLFADC